VFRSTKSTKLNTFEKK